VRHTRPHRRPGASARTNDAPMRSRLDALRRARGRLTSSGQHDMGISRLSASWRTRVTPPHGWRPRVRRVGTTRRSGCSRWTRPSSAVSS
jgi:hypothetical protein